MANHTEPRCFVTIGMFIVDEFEYCDEDGKPTRQHASSEIGGGGTYAAVGARIWLPPNLVGCIIDRGPDFPPNVQDALDVYGSDMWLYRDQIEYKTTRALNTYRGSHRDFKYLTPRLQITPRDLIGNKLNDYKSIHFICSPTRAATILSELAEIHRDPITIYEPIPDRCTPDELPSLRKVIKSIHILSPNAEEALSLLSIPIPTSGLALKAAVQKAAQMFLDFGIGAEGSGYIIIRSGEHGAYVSTRGGESKWVEAYWIIDTSKIVDVTGAGNSFLGGLAAGLHLAKGNVYEASYYASVSASFIIEQNGLPKVSRGGHEADLWNGDSPMRRLQELKTRAGVVVDN